MYGLNMSSKTISTSYVRKLSAELDCAPDTIRRVFLAGKPTAWPISRRIYEALIRDGYLDASR